jgi:hypothetical protein
VKIYEYWRRIELGVTVGVKVRDAQVRDRLKLVSPRVIERVVVKHMKAFVALTEQVLFSPNAGTAVGIKPKQEVICEEHVGVEDPILE